MWSSSSRHVPWAWISESNSEVRTPSTTLGGEVRWKLAPTSCPSMPEPPAMVVEVMPSILPDRAGPTLAARPRPPSSPRRT
ncbi:hypothetical protein ACFFX0_03135 [Citricoccus parietis]|uniref:Uncharacterized protein n=1 Tax=Citricoccus parietis TaxID=592307 RepID=A0ABV5FU99_9MICC